MGFNHAELFTACAGAMPSRDAIVHGGASLSYAELLDRSRRFANLLSDEGVGLHRERPELQPWESGQDHVGLYLYNGWEYLAATLGANLARAVPFNVNYRYVASELAYLLDDARCRVVVYHEAFAPTLAAVLPLLDRRPMLLQVADGSGHDLLDGASDFVVALDSANDAELAAAPRDDDLYLLYTGGTTGLPKGTLWRQGDIYDAALRPAGARRRLDGASTIESVVEVSAARQGPRLMALPPFMHGAAQWAALGMLLSGGTVVIQQDVTRLDPADVWDTVEEHGVEVMTIVGDAFARPLLEELEVRPRATGSLTQITSGGAMFSPELKRRCRTLLPHCSIADVGGSSESGRQIINVTKPGPAEPLTRGVFVAQEGTCVLDESRQRILSAGHEEIGWLARKGAIPLGYLGDADKTAATFPMVQGVRMAVPGDRARLRADGLVELLGRESVTINTGGEKVFAEEVEHAIIRHAAVDDAVVVGRPSPRWGQEVVAVIQLRPEADVTDDDIIRSTEDALARYKHPKALVRVDEVVRSPAGKADYAWALRRAMDDVRQRAGAEKPSGRP